MWTLRTYLVINMSIVKDADSIMARVEYNYQEQIKLLHQEKHELKVRQSRLFVYTFLPNINLIFEINQSNYVELLIFYKTANIVFFFTFPENRI